MKAELKNKTQASDYKAAHSGLLTDDNRNIDKIFGMNYVRLKSYLFSLLNATYISMILKKVFLIDISDIMIHLNWCIGDYVNI